MLARLAGMTPASSATETRIKQAMRKLRGSLALTEKSRLDMVRANAKAPPMPINNPMAARRAV